MVSIFFAEENIAKNGSHQRFQDNYLNLFCSATDVAGVKSGVLQSIILLYAMSLLA